MLSRYIEGEEEENLELFLFFLKVLFLDENHIRIVWLSILTQGAMTFDTHFLCNNWIIYRKMIKYGTHNIRFSSRIEL